MSRRNLLWSGFKITAWAYQTNCYYLRIFFRGRMSGSARRFFTSKHYNCLTNGKAKRVTYWKKILWLLKAKVYQLIACYLLIALFFPMPYHGIWLLTRFGFWIVGSHYLFFSCEFTDASDSLFWWWNWRFYWRCLTLKKNHLTWLPNTSDFSFFKRHRNFFLSFPI